MLWHGETMIFDNAGALGLLVILPPLLFGLGLWGWRAKQEVAVTFPLVLWRLRRKQVEKFILAGVLMALLVVALALPKVATSVVAAPEKTGEVVLLVDVSDSMAAKKHVSSPNRLERIRPMLYEIIDSLELLGQVKISLHGFTNTARSHVPFVGIEDYPYLRESIGAVLDINSTPGEGSSLGQPILDVAGKFSEGEPNKLLILFGDGEPFAGLTRGMTDYEGLLIDKAVETAGKQGIRVITVGVGEREGAKIPVFSSEGQFTGEYAKLLNVDRTTYRDYISYLEEDGLKKIAAGTNGRYFSEEDRGELINYIGENLGPAAEEAAAKEVKVYRSIAHWFVLAALPVWIVLVRRHLR